jgi:hypothetical protein
VKDKRWHVQGGQWEKTPLEYRWSDTPDSAWEVDCFPDVAEEVVAEDDSVD